MAGATGILNCTFSIDKNFQSHPRIVEKEPVILPTCDQGKSWTTTDSTCDLQTDLAAASALFASQAPFGTPPTASTSFASSITRCLWILTAVKC